MKSIPLRSLMIVLTVLLASPLAASAETYRDGTLLKAVDGAKVYILEDGRKRWIETEDAFRAHGFAFDGVVTVSPHELDIYEDENPVTLATDLDLPAEDELLPDLIPLPAYDLRYATVDGRTALRFTGTFWNRGPGTLELLNTDVVAEDDRTHSDGSGGDSFYATQLIEERLSGQPRERDAGQVYFHPAHDHYHLDEFSEYRLESVSVDGGTSQTRTTKVSFCLRDDEQIDAGVDNASASPVYTDCASERQGVSAGWADVYRSTLPNQFVDVEGLPAGIYRLIFEIDRPGHLLEGSGANNRSAVLVRLDPAARTFELLASAAPFASVRNEIKDGLLLRAERSGRMYITQGGKKRWLRSDAAIASYGFAREDALAFPESIIDAIPSERFVRLPDGRIFMTNEHGYIRRILNPQVLASYDTGSIPEVSDEEFATFQFTGLIRREGSERVYSVSSKTLVGFDWQLSQLDVPQRSVHEVSSADFRSFAVAEVETGLTIPWGAAFLPGGDMLVTERPGRLRRFGAAEATIDVPGVLHSGEGGLMGIALHPDFASNRFIYLYYTTREDGSENRVVRYRLEGGALALDKVILSGIPGATYHDGGQIAFGPDGMLYVTAGDASQAHLAQNRDSLAGSTLRVTPEGNIPSDNPFATAVWSYGHRNAQGLAWDAEGNLWATEHGRSGALSGFDELNLIERGANYGWPDIQGPETAPGMRAPALQSGCCDTWAPSGLAFHEGTLYFSGLRGARLYAVDVENGTPTRVREYLQDEFGRLRSAQMGPDNMLYLTTSNRDGRGSVRAGDDKVLKIAPGMLDEL